jgi:glycosyltransferase involved in cell wall biosynthesis
MAALRICLVSTELNQWGGIGHAARRLANLLAERHEVTVIHSGGWEGDADELADGVTAVSAEPGPELAAMSFACDDHLRSAAVLDAIDRAYGSAGPDLLEASDFRAHALVPLQARRAGHPLLERTLIALKVASTSELLCLHDAALNQPGMRRIGDLEREQFRLADRLIWPGGDILNRYRDYYSGLSLPEAVRIRFPLEQPASPPAPERRDPELPLRLLFVGRLQRLKGALDLVEACLALPYDDWELTMFGDDTETAPLGQSVRMTIEEMCAGDSRVKLEGPIPHRDLQERWHEHDLLVVPSRFEVWSNVVLEGMRAGMPILATPVGGASEAVEPGVTGWQADGLGAAAIGRSIVEVFEHPDELERIRSSGAIFERFEQLTDPEEILDGYERLLASREASPRPARPARREPLVSGVVPYHRAAPWVRGAADSLLAQTHDRLEVVLVNDGSFEKEDAVLEEVARDPRVRVVTQLNRGEPGARNLGACVARGEYLVMLDADNILEPEFVERALAAFERCPDAAYVTCWLRYIDGDGRELDGGGYVPLGNRVLADDSQNWDGDMLAMLPRALFSELGYRFEPTSGLQSDWELYRTLRDDGRFGMVIPEALARYRVHGESLSRTLAEPVHERSWDEALVRRELRRHRWTAEA